MRPLYETAEHLSTEKAIAEQFERANACSFIKLPIRYHLDYAIEKDGVIRAFCEIKTTRYDFNTHTGYGGFKISFAKWCAAEQMSRLAGVPFVLIVGFPDAPRWLKTQDFKHDGLVWWGRRGRGDPQDMEPAVVLKTSRFNSI